MVTIYDNILNDAFLEDLEGLLLRYNFIKQEPVNGIHIFKHLIISDYYHEVICWPNGMLEFKHQMYGRVFYARFESDLRFEPIIKACFPGVSEIINNDDLPW